MYPMVHQGRLVVLRGTPSKLIVTMVQQLVLKNGYNISSTEESIGNVLKCYCVQSELRAREVFPGNGRVLGI